MLVVGFLLGGKVGVGTVLFALLIGPCVEGSFVIVSRSRLGAAPRSGYDRLPDSRGEEDLLC